MIHGHRLLDLHHFEDTLNTIATEDAQDVVFCREEELGLTRIPLPARPSPKLVVDAARLMTLGAKDKQASNADDIVMFLRARVAVVCEQLCILFRLFLRVDLGVCKSHRVSTQQNVDTSARHVGGNSDRAFATRLGDDLSFLFVILGIENLMLDAELLQLMAQCFRCLDGTRTHKDGLSFLMPCLDLAEDRVQFAALGAVDFIVRILAAHWTVCGYLEDIKSVDFLELVCFCERRSCHPGQLVIHLEKVLDRDCCQRLALLADLEPFLCLDGLVQPFRVATSIHESTRELIDNDDFRVLDDVLAVLPEEDLCSDGVAKNLAIGGLLLHQRVFGNLGSTSKTGQQILGRIDCLVLLVVDVVGAGWCLIVTSGHLGANRSLQPLDECSSLVVWHVRVTTGARDDKSCPSFIDEDVVDFVDDGKVESSLLKHAVFRSGHMISQVVEAELVICTIGDVGCVCSSTLFRRAVVLKEADRHAKEFIDRPHPGPITLGQVIVDGNKVPSMTHNGVEVQGTGGHERLPFAGLHLRDIAKVERDTSKELFGEELQPYETASRFSYQREGFRQQLGLGGACRSPLSELSLIHISEP